MRDKYRLAALCDVDESRLMAVAKDTRAKLYRDAEKMIDEEKMDVCLIAVQPEGHHVVAKALAEQGVNILTETPISITTTCADQMIEAARSSDVLLEVSENVPRWLHERLKQKIVNDGVIGDVKRFYLSYITGAYHGFAAIRSILRDEAKSVTGEFPPEDAIVERAEILFSSDVEGVYECNRERGNYWEIIGTQGSLRGNQLDLAGYWRKFVIQTIVENLNNVPEITCAKVDTQPEIVVQNPVKGYPLLGFDDIATAETWISSYKIGVHEAPIAYVDDVARAETWISLHNAVTYGTPLTYGAENARKDLELSVAIRESASSDGRKVNLPLASVTDHEELVHKKFAEAYGSDPLELSLEHLKIKYTLPDSLRELMYRGRVLTKDPQK